MKTWSKADLISALLVVFGIVCLIFSNSSILSLSCFFMAAVILLHGVYIARYDALKYRDILCHYQAVLSTSSGGWIAWNGDGEYIGSSRTFRLLFAMKPLTGISVADIAGTIDEYDAQKLIFFFNKLRKNSSPFSATVTNTKNNYRIKIDGSRLSISNLDTLVLWCYDVTSALEFEKTMSDKLIVAESVGNSLMEMMDTVPIPIWKRGKDFRIRYCNKAYADALDTVVDNVVAENMQLVPGNLFGQGYSLAENAKKSNRLQSISQFVVIRGIRKKLCLHECPASGESLIGFATDMTAEEALAANLDRVVTANYEVLESLSTAIAIFGENTRLQFFNSAYQQLMKLEAGWLHSRPTYGEIMDECRNNRQLPEYSDYQAFKKSQLALFTSITSPTQELMHLSSGKTLRSMVAHYPLGGLLFVFEDVTDSLMLQRKNNTLLAVQRETIDHLHEGVAVYGSDNRLKIANSSMEKMWNLRDNDIKGTHIADMLEQIKGLLDYGSDWDVFKESTISNLTDRIAKSGKLFKNDNSTIMFSYIPLPDGAHMLSFIDITDTCKVETAITEKNQAMKAAQNLRYEFVSGISAELRDPLNSLIGFTELLTHQYFGALNEKQMEYCRCILSLSNQLNQLINNLLEMVSIDIDASKLDISNFIIDEAIIEVIENVEKRAAEKHISITTNFERFHMLFRGDKKRIKQSLFNILINAIQSTPVNGEIHIRTIIDSGNFKLIIKDESILETKDNKKRVFRRSTDSANPRFFGRVQESNSISVSLVRAIMELHGGTLGVTLDAGGRHIICSFPLIKVAVSAIDNNPAKKQNIGAAELDHISAYQDLLSTNVGTVVADDKNPDMGSDGDENSPDLREENKQVVNS
ncbi:MAG: PAS-domain containing protein [Holosporaceae bacterium]|jgi:signal transduction histidine kinase|nr:PAS-domain containing protein [Holosporaceae bacterium]